ncbi:MAG: hypothetical protein HY922_01700 [Elusimicrobia bacterium]|nr:hypothetical protein [Elusimicrobiota bacterium]
MSTKTKRMRAAVVVFALAALGALAICPRTASTADTYSDGYSEGYKAGVAEQKRIDQNNAKNQQEQDAGADKGGCCGGG